MIEIAETNAPAFPRTAVRVARWLVVVVALAACAWRMHVLLVIQDAGYGKLDLAGWATQCAPYVLGVLLVRWPTIPLVPMLVAFAIDIVGTHDVSASMGKDAMVGAILVPWYAAAAFLFGLFIAVVARLGIESSTDQDG